MISSWAALSYPDLAFEVMRLFIDPADISDPELHTLVEKSYSVFKHADVVPLVKVLYAIMKHALVVVP